MDPDTDDDYQEEDEDYEDEDGSSGAEDSVFENNLDSNGDLNNYSSMGTQELVTVMNKTVQDIQVIMNMKKPALVRDLLTEYNWDKSLLLEKLYLNSMEPEKKKVCQQSAIVPDIGDGPQECEICFDDCPKNMMVGLDCGHRYCKECWTEFLRTKIVDEGLSQTISCPTPKCETVIDDDLVTGLIKDELVRSKYNRLIVNGFVQCNKRMKWCPAASCYRVIQVTELTEILQVECNCGNRFCFKCGGDWHAPVTCHFMKKWLMVEHQENATMNWITDNTRACPHCQSNIEKRGGCNHMFCSQCKKNFCWTCMDKVCQGSSCRNTISAAEKKMRDEKDRTKTYFFYFQHYHNHRKSLGFENELRTKLATQMDTVKNTIKCEVWSQLTFLQTAADILCKCRQTLMHCYVFSYFLEESNQLDIFKHNLADLQVVTEELSQMLEQKVDYKNVDKMRVPIFEKTAYCRSRRKALLGHICEGYEEGWWSWWA